MWWWASSLNYFPGVETGLCIFFGITWARHAICYKVEVCVNSSAWLHMFSKHKRMTKEGVREKGEGKRTTSIAWQFHHPASITFSEHMLLGQSGRCILVARVSALGIWWQRVYHCVNASPEFQSTCDFTNSYASCSVKGQWFVLLLGERTKIKFADLGKRCNCERFMWLSRVILLTSNCHPWGRHYNLTPLQNECDCTVYHT